MKPERSLAPRYCHLLEVLDGAASLHAAIRCAEAALLDAEVEPRERELLESVLEVSRDRQEQVRAILESPAEVREGTAGEGAGDDQERASDEDLAEAGRTARNGSEEAERFACRALDRIARSLDLASRASVEPFLSHESPALRASAMKVLAMHWRISEYAERVRWALACDDEPECRRAAALSLGSLFEGTRDPAVGAELAGCVGRLDESPDVRWASYYALLALDGCAPGARPLPTEDFDPRRDADPALLTRYAPS